MKSSWVINCVNMEVVSKCVRDCLCLHQDLVWWVLCLLAVLTQEATVCTSLDCKGNSGHSPTVRDVLSQQRPCRSSEFTLLFAGPSSWCFTCFLTFMARYHILLRMKPISLLKLSRCSWISMASFTNVVHAACHSCQYHCVPEVQLMLCRVAVFHHCWLKVIF
jgi:hypothetical protein